MTDETTAETLADTGDALIDAAIRSALAHGDTERAESIREAYRKNHEDA
jgi:hypothetical protein